MSFQCDIAKIFVLSLYKNTNFVVEFFCFSLIAFSANLWYNNKTRGFTLVELIVVLVILAILAALLVPALTGYIDKAKKNHVIAETRMLTQAAQTELSSLYATDEFAVQKSTTQIFTVASKDGSLVSNIEHEQKLTNLIERYNDIVQLSEVPSLISETGYFFVVANPSCKIQWVVYSDGKGYYGIYCNEDGSFEAFDKDELTNYDTYKVTYGGKVFCTVLEDNKQEGAYRYMWSKNFFYACLGVEGYSIP